MEATFNFRVRLIGPESCPQCAQAVVQSTLFIGDEPAGRLDLVTLQYPELSISASITRHQP